MVYLFSSESVFKGHPDKVADQISDAILDAHLDVDPEARVACNTLVAKDLVVIAGEITSRAQISCEEIIRAKLQEIGYTDPSCGLDGKTCEILTSISRQSKEIAKAVNDLRAGDQGTMFGYATDETPELMPLGIHLANRLAEKQADLLKNGQIPWMKPDGKTQVTLRYIDSKPMYVETVIFSTHHAKTVKNAEIRDTIISEIIEKVIPAELKGVNIRYLINPGGRFETGGPQADTGLTGRKVIMDTYGGYCAHGGGAFSGKDPTKVDRSAAYMARYIAKGIVAAKLASRCTIQISYAIGKAEPTSLMVDLHDTGQVDEYKLVDAVYQLFPLNPKGIIDCLNLRRPIYQKTAVFGHFGRELPEFTWERTDMAFVLRDYFNF